jgi:hypothetical protein
MPQTSERFRCRGYPGIGAVWKLKRFLCENFASGFAIFAVLHGLLILPQSTQRVFAKRAKQTAPVPYPPAVSRFF